MGSTQGKAEIKAPGRMKIGEKIIVFPHLGSNVWKTERERDLLHRILEMMEIKWDKKADRLDESSTCSGICFSTQKNCC